MFSRLILCASPGCLAAGCWRLGRCVDSAEFAHGEQGRQGLGRFLQGYAGVPLYLVVDTTEEDYRVEVLPHAAGAAGREMLARRLGQVYRSQRYRAAQFLGREQEKRQDDRFLFMALNDSDCIDPWLPAIEAPAVPLAGIYLLPTVSQLLLQALNIRAPHLLLAARLHDGVRLSYFRYGRLHWSRLVAAGGMDEGTAVKLLCAEVEQTRLALFGLRLIGMDTPLRLVLAGIGDGVGRELDAAARRLEIVALDAKAAGRRFRLREAAPDRFAELLHMHALAWRTPQANLATPAQTGVLLANRLRGAINLAGATAALGGIALSAHLLQQAAGHGRQAALAQIQAAGLEAREREAARGLSRPAYSGSEMKAAVELAQRLSGEAKTPARLMRAVGAALDQIPEPRLNRLRWTLAEDPGLQDDGLYEIGFVEGEIGTPAGDDRVYREGITRLAGLLGNDDAVQRVEIVRQPAAAGLQGNTAANPAPHAAVSFALKVWLKR